MLLYEGKEIAYKLYNERTFSPRLEDEKTLNKRVDQAIERQSKTPYKSAADHPWRRCAGSLTKHGFPSERVDKSLLSVETDSNNLTTLNHTLPTIQRAEQDTNIKTPAGQ